MRRWSAALVLVAFLSPVFTFLQPGEAQQSATHPDYATRLEADLEARLFHDLSIAPGDEWFLLSTGTVPGGAVAGFHWAIPPDARYPLAGDRYSLFMEFAPWTDAPELSAEREWGIFVFVDTPEGMHFVGALLEVMTYGRDWTGPLVTRILDYPSGVPVQAGLIAPNSLNDLYFAVAARGPVGEEFGLGVRVWQKALFSQDPQPNRTAFLAAQVRPDPYVPLRTGEGQGVTWDGYGAGASLFAFAAERVYGDMQVGNTIPVDGRPAATVRDLHLSSEGARGSGWSDIEAFLMQRYGQSVWATEGELFGTAFEAEGVAASGGPVPFVDIASWLLTGAPSFHLTNEGVGDGAVHYDLATVDINYLDLFSLVHVGFGVPLENLLGSASVRQVDLFDGILGPEGPVAHLAFDGDRTSLSAGHANARIAFPGPAPSPPHEE